MKELLKKKHWVWNFKRGVREVNTFVWLFHRITRYRFV